MNYRVVHLSRYDYSSTAALSLNEACLWARSTPFQTVVSQTLTTDPADDYRQTRTDFFGNTWIHLSFEQPHRYLEIVSEQRLRVTRAPGQGWDDPVIEPYRSSSPYVPLRDAWADYGRPSFAPGRLVVDAVRDLTERLFEDFVYDARATDIGTTTEEFFRLRRGVCQDFAHLMIAVLRSLGHPARYVSGYLNTVPTPGKEKVWGADASHAWASVWIEGHGWVDFDPTNGVVVGDQHVTVAWGRDYGDVTPLRGVVLGGGTQTLDVQVTVLGED